MLIHPTPPHVYLINVEVLPTELCYWHSCHGACWSQDHVVHWLMVQKCLSYVSMKVDQ